MTKSNKYLALFIALLCSAVTATAANSGNLRVGAARIDITPKSFTGLKNVWGTFIDIGPQTLHMDLLMINQIALAGVAAEVVTNIYYRLRHESPLVNTILVSLNNGRLTYIPDDAAYDAPIFEVRASSLKRGCGENAIVKSFVEMIKRRLTMLDGSESRN